MNVGCTYTALTWKKYMALSQEVNWNLGHTNWYLRILTPLSILKIQSANLIFRSKLPSVMLFRKFLLLISVAMCNEISIAPPTILPFNYLGNGSVNIYQNYRHLLISLRQVKWTSLYHSLKLVIHSLLLRCIYSYYKMVLVEYVNTIKERIRTSFR